MNPCQHDLAVSAGLVDTLELKWPVVTISAVKEFAVGYDAQ
jgi:hypothetical protein